MSIFPQIEEIKRTNKLWSNNSLFARKSITIQLTPETYEKLRQGAEGKISDADAAKKRLETKKAAAQEEFKRITDCKEDSVIDFYLETFHFNVDRAVRKFQIGTPSFHRTSLNTKHIFLLFLLICQKMSWLRVTERAVWTPRSSIQVFCYQRTILFRLDHQARVYPTVIHCLDTPRIAHRTATAATRRQPASSRTWSDSTTPNHRTVVKRTRKRTIWAPRADTSHMRLSSATIQTCITSVRRSRSNCRRITTRCSICKYWSFDFSSCAVCSIED
jgi:hypothetical protein